jgi:hypothetical protein
MVGHRGIEANPMKVDAIRKMAKPSNKKDVMKLLTVKIRQPSHEFTFGVGISFIPYPLVLTPVV